MTRLRGPKIDSRAEKLAAENEPKKNLMVNLVLEKSKKDSRRSSSSIPYLIIGMKNRLLAHFYSRHYENEIGQWQEAPSTLGSYIYRLK
jgi:hypothetical protein